MGGFLPTMAMSALQMGFDAASQSAQMKAEEANAKAKVGQIRADQLVDERQRRQRLKEALASQRARFGGRGIASTGSANAVLSGMAAEAARQSADAQRIGNSRINTVTTKLESGFDRNLLSASEPVNRMTMNLIQKNLRTVPLLDA